MLKLSYFTEKIWRGRKFQDLLGKGPTYNRYPNPATKKNYFRIFHIFLSYFLTTHPNNYKIELAQLQNELHIPANDELDISGQFRVMVPTNLFHTHTRALVRIFCKTSIFRLREIGYIKNHRNLRVEKSYRYKTFSLKKQKYSSNNS